VCVVYWQILDLWNMCARVRAFTCVCMLLTVAVHTMTNITTKQQQLRPPAYLPGHCTTPLKFHILMKLATGAAWKQSQSCHSVQRLFDNYCRSWITCSHALNKSQELCYKPLHFYITKKWLREKAIRYFDHTTKVSGFQIKRLACKSESALTGSAAPMWA